MRNLLFLLVTFLAAVSLVSCSEDESVPEPPTQLQGYEWKLETQMPLENYYTYEVGRTVAFNTKGSGWIGWNKNDKYRLGFTFEECHDRKDTYCVYLHVKYPEFSYYFADVKVEGTTASFLLFASYEDFYQYNRKGINTGIPITLTYQGKYR